jgi:NTP pyrophosphatase (non-canonical NTP hydrolase)
MAIEEMSELQKELCKLYRGIYKKENIAEEIADVLITVSQIIVALNIREEVNNFKELKIKKLEELVYG